MTDHRLISDGELHLTGPVGFIDFNGEGFTVRDVTEALSEMDGDITVKINSGGGFAFDGIAIHSLLRQYDGTVTTVAQGIAASAASVIFMAGEERVMAEGAMLMIHDASGITMGTETDHLKTAKGLGKLSNSLAGIYARATSRGIDVERAAMREETWLDGADAVEAGFATSEIDGGEAEASAFDYTLYMNAPAFLVERARDVADQFGHEQAALTATPRPPSKEDTMSEETKSVVAETKPAPESEVKIDLDAIKAEAKQAESDRIQECLAVKGMTDASDATKALAFDGKSDAGAVALAVITDAWAKGADHLAKLAKAEAEMVDAGLKTAPSATVSEKKTETAATPEGWKAAWDSSEDLRAEYVRPEDYVSYMKANTAGRIKVQGK